MFSGVPTIAENMSSTFDAIIAASAGSVTVEPTISTDISEVKKIASRAGDGV
jgi:hypothetical protein